VAPLHLGLDLGGTNIKSVVLDASSPVNVIARPTLPTRAMGGPEEVLERLKQAGNEAIDEFGPFATIGLGVPGLFEPTSGRVKLFPNLPGPWDGFPLGEVLAREWGLRAAMINDARAFTLAESTMGAGRGAGIVVAMVLGTGVGGGITIDGRLHLGAFGTAGELGHQTVIPDGPECGCGNRGCVEVLTRADALASLAGKQSAEAVYAGAADGERQCLDAIAQVAEYLGIALANTVTLIGPDVIVVGGGIAAAGDLLLEPLRDSIRRRVTLVPVDELVVVPASLGSSAGAIGAALAGRDQSEEVRAR
jgi:glucokinase